MDVFLVVQNLEDEDGVIPIRVCTSKEKAKRVIELLQDTWVCQDASFSIRQYQLAEE